MRDEDIGDGDLSPLDPDEQHFWQRSIKKYLKPLKKDKVFEERMSQVQKNKLYHQAFLFWLESHKTKLEILLSWYSTTMLSLFTTILFQDLITLRNNTGFGFWFVNMLWVIFNYMVQKDTRLVLIISGNKVQPLGFIFLVIFMAILCLQVVMNQKLGIKILFYLTS